MNDPLVNRYSTMPIAPFTKEFTRFYNATVDRLDGLVLIAKTLHSNVDEVKRKFIPNLMYAEDGPYVLKMYQGAKAETLLNEYIDSISTNPQGCVNLMYYLRLAE